MPNISLDTDPQLQAAASPQVLRSGQLRRYVARMHRVAFAISALVLCLAPTFAEACSCLTGKPVEEQFRAAKSVLVGQVLVTRYIPDKSVFGGGYIEATVLVKEPLKGRTGASITVKDQIPEGGMCTAFLRAGIEFVLFIDQDDSVSMCNGTRPLGATIYDRPEKLKELHDLKARAERGT